jgi:serine/threonine protein kinase
MFKSHHGHSFGASRTFLCTEILVSLENHGNRTPSSILQRRPGLWVFTTRVLSRVAAWKAALKRIPDDIIYPKVPENAHLTIAPEDALSSNPELYHVKRQRFGSYYEFRDLPQRPQQLLAETFIMEALSGPDPLLPPPHPSIIRCHGCCVHRGYITGIVLERLEYNLRDYVKQNGSRVMIAHRKSLFAKLSSAVDYLHSLGLAHNDIKPANIMIREMPDGRPEPVLIDFGSCAPFGCGVFTMGTPGWCEEDFTTSEKRHDIYSLGKVEE